MRRVRRLAIVLIAVGLVTSAIYVTGAFDSFTAQRNANVQVADDAGGYLGLHPASGDNGEYVSYTKAGELELSLDSVGDGGSQLGAGVNANGQMQLDNVFTITNQGTSPVSVWLQDTEPNIRFYNGSTPLEKKRNAVKLDPGQSVGVGFSIDTTNTNVEKLQTDLTVNADSDVSGARAPDSDGSDSSESVPPVQDSDQSAQGSSGGDSGDEQKRDCGLTCLDDDAKDRLFTDDGAIDLDGNEEDDVQQVTNEVSEVVKSPLEKANEYIQKFNNDIGAVIDFLEKHPALKAMILGGIPGVGIGVWAHENPEQARSFALGSVLGEMGMPKGLAEVTQSESPFYLLGMLGLASTPYVGVVADTRDFIQNSYSAITELDVGEFGEATLDAIGIAGSLGAFGLGDAPKVASVTASWIKNFGRSPVVVKTMATFLANSASRVQIRVGLDLVSDGGATVLLNRGESMSEIIEYSMKGTLKKNAEILSKRPPNTAKITNDQYTDIVNRGYEEQFVNSMVKHGVSGKQQQALIDAGIDLKEAKPLVKEGFSGDAVLTLTQKGIDPETAMPLAKEGATSDDVLLLNRKNADLGLAGELATDDVPVDDIKYYAKKGNDLENVKWAVDMDIKPKYIKRMFRAKNSRKFVVDVGVTGGEAYTIANNYCNWQRQSSVDKSWKAESLCQTIQMSPLDESNSKIAHS